MLHENCNNFHSRILQYFNFQKAKAKNIESGPHFCFILYAGSILFNIFPKIENQSLKSLNEIKFNFNGFSILEISNINYITKIFYNFITPIHFSKTLYIK